MYIEIEECRWCGCLSVYKHGLCYVCFEEWELAKKDGHLVSADCQLVSKDCQLEVDLEKCKASTTSHMRLMLPMRYRKYAFKRFDHLNVA